MPTTLSSPAWPASTATTVVIIFALLVAAVTGVLALLDRPLPRWALALVALLEVALVVLTIVCIAAWIGGTAPFEPVVFLCYLAVCLVAPPASAWWGSGEPGRWGTGVVCLAALLIPVLLTRMEQVWTGLA